MLRFWRFLGLEVWGVRGVIERFKLWDMGVGGFGPCEL